MEVCCSGSRFNIKMLSYQYGKSYCGDKTVVRSSYLHNGIKTGKTVSLYWIGALLESGHVYLRNTHGSTGHLIMTTLNYVVMYLKILSGRTLPPISTIVLPLWSRKLAPTWTPRWWVPQPCKLPIITLQSASTFLCRLRLDMLVDDCIAYVWVLICMRIWELYFLYDCFNTKQIHPMISLQRKCHFIYNLFLIDRYYY